MTAELYLPKGDTYETSSMHGYRQPLVLEEVPVLDIAADDVILKVGAGGMWRTDVQLIDGYFEKYT